MFVLIFSIMGGVASPPFPFVVVILRERGEENEGVYESSSLLGANGRNGLRTSFERNGTI